MKFNIFSDLGHFWDYNIKYDVTTVYGNWSLSELYSRFYEKSDFVLSLPEHTRIYYKIIRHKRSNSLHYTEFHVSTIIFMDFICWEEGGDRGGVPSPTPEPQWYSACFLCFSFHKRSNSLHYTEFHVSTMFFIDFIWGVLLQHPPGLNYLSNSPVRIGLRK